MATRDHFRIIIDDLAAKAKATLPENAGRIDAAVALVLAGDVALQPDGLAIVGSATSPLTTYPVNGQCACPDYPRAPQSWCKHRIARAMALRAERAMHALGDAEASRIAQDTSTLAQTSTPPPPRRTIQPGTCGHRPSTISGWWAPCPLVHRAPWTQPRGWEPTHPPSRLEARTQPRRSWRPRSR